MTEELTSDAPKTHAELGQWITRCGPKGKASTFGLVLEIIFLLVGVFCLIVGFTVTPKPGSEMMRPIFIGLGIGVIVIGLLCLLLMALWKNPQVDLYSNGIRFLAKGNEHFIPWAEMQKIRMTKFYDTRFSHYRVVEIARAGQDDLEFESKLEGEPDRVIDAILENAPDVEQMEIDLGA